MGDGRQRGASSERAAWPCVPVFFATTQGQAGRVARALARRLCERGLEAEAIDLAREGARERGWERVRGVALCASVHVRGHQRSARRFALRQCEALGAVPSLFVSVCLAIRSERPAEREEARAIARSFGEKTGWRPDRSVCVAGRLAYTSYGPLVRFVMKRIAAAEGGSTDTSRDHEYTDWAEVDRLADDLASRVTAATRGALHT